MNLIPDHLHSLFQIIWDTKKLMRLKSEDKVRGAKQVEIKKKEKRNILKQRIEKHLTCREENQKSLTFK